MSQTIGTISVLHVDDDSGIAELMATFLEEENERFEVETATDVDEALEHLAEANVDCIVSDYEMPGRNGIEFLEAVRDANPDLPFILYTGRGSEEVASDAISAGVTDYLQKDSGTGQFTVLANRITNAVKARQSNQLLRKRTRQLETLISNLPGMIYRCRNEPDWPMETVEGEVESLTGYTARALEQNEVNWGTDVVHPADQEEVWEAIQEGLSEDGTFELTYRIVTSGGETKWIWEQGRGIHADDGTVEALEGFMTDITARKRREKRLGRTTARLEALFENSPDMINVHDTEGTIIDPNPRLCEKTGYGKSELEGMNIWELDQAITTAEARALWDRMDLGDSVWLNGEYRRTDGSTFPVEVHLSRLDIDGNDRFLAISRDITERMERERELARYSETLERLQRTTKQLLEARDVEEATDIVLESIEEVLEFDVVGIWQYEDATEQLEPITITQTGQALVPDPPVYSAETNSLSWDAFVRNTMRVIDDVHEHDERHNPDTPIRSEIIVPLDEYGLINIGATEPDAFTEQDVALVELWAETVTIAIDRIERERDLRNREEELLRERDRLDEFASIVSHDLRNPLNVATLRLDLVRQECESDHLDDIADAHERMDALVDDLLTLARQGDSVSNTEPVDLPGVAEDCWRTVETADASVRVETDRTIRANPSRLRQLLENLVRNAIEHGGDGVTVTVGDLEDGFYVEDDGPGVPAENQEAVFDASYSTTENGTGFGLSIVRQVANAHDWTVGLTDGAEGGARFEITGVEVVER